MVDAVILDWNGTISSKVYDNKFFESLVLRSILNFPDCINLVKVLKFIKNHSMVIVLGDFGSGK